ncbi:MAG: EsaB/YukD family protein [Clostridia bacterium]|nr:EsaB/YukD family protein [Clostridia bacterium]
METILAEISVPACSAAYDFMLPEGVSVGIVVREIVRILETTGLNIGFDAENTHLCDIDSHNVLDPSLTLAEQGVRDGVCLMIV